MQWVCNIKPLSVIRCIRILELQICFSRATPVVVLACGKDRMLKLAFVSFRPAAAPSVLCNGLITAQFQNIFLADVRRHVPVSSDTFRSSFVPCTNVAREDADRADRLGISLGVTMRIRLISSSN